MTSRTAFFILLMTSAISRNALAQEMKSVEAPASANYRLSAGDVIAIRIFPQPNMDRQCRVGKDGSIDFPLIGTVNLAGKTTTEAGANLATLLNKDYLVNPQVTVDIVSYAKQYFVVMGQVQNAGSFAFPDEKGLTLVAAIATAGGATRLADLSKVIIQRPDTAPISIDLRPNAKTPSPFQVLPNDVIFVRERMF